MNTATATAPAASTAKGSTAQEATPRTKKEILQLLEDGSTDSSLYEELRKINATEAKVKEERKTIISKLVADMGKYNITVFDLREAGLAIPNLGSTAAKKTRAQSDGSRENITYAGKNYNWTRNLDDAAKLPLYEAFKAGKSVKSFFIKPNDKAAAARLIARLERETAELDDKGATKKAYEYSEANLKELGLTRADIKKAVTLKATADTKKAAKGKTAKAKK